MTPSDLTSSLIPPQAIEEITRVFEYGATKHGLHNWRGPNPGGGDPCEAAKRHIAAHQSGAVFDHETNRFALAHAAARIIMALALEIELDFWPRSDDQQATILMDILAERSRQDAKWGSNRSMPNYNWATVLGEEFGEVCNASLERDYENLRTELVQVAAVAVAWVESLDSKEAANAH